MARFPATSAAASDDDDSDDEYDLADPISSPLIVPSTAASAAGGCRGGGGGGGQDSSMIAALVAALRKSLICSAGVGDDGAMSAIDVSWPTDVQHVSHVTFDRFSGFLGLPVEFESEVFRAVPSASASVFGVSAKSMQCSYDSWGNSVPTILLSMQRHLYAQGGLLVEGIFRINGENSQELYVRDQLNRGVVPQRVDLHCLAGLIKAWFRELPMGVLDSLTPDEVMHCNTEEECSELVRMLPTTESALLDWAINLMADVVENEHHNKMNARNIAMVFAPNMTQMADPLTALLHAVQVMNFLKTLIIKTIREREDAAAAEARVFHSCSESPRGEDRLDSSQRRLNGKGAQILISIREREDAAAAEARVFHSCSESPWGEDRLNSSNSTETSNNGMAKDFCAFEGAALNNFSFRAEQSFKYDNEERFHCSEGLPKFSFKAEQSLDYDNEEMFHCSEGSPITSNLNALEGRSKFEYSNGYVEGILHRLSFREGVRKLYKHPVFQLSKSVKKPQELEIISS